MTDFRNAQKFALRSVTDLTTKEINELDVLCLGHFNVLHLGHFRFIDFASSMGENLCVLLKGDEELSAVEKENFFSETDRAEALIQINTVSKIVKRGQKSFEECFEILKPKCVVLGHEFRHSNDISVKNMISFATRLGIKVVFHSGDRNLNFGRFSRKPLAETTAQKKSAQAFLKTCARRKIDLKSITRNVASFSSLRCLVIGDIIVDEFISCEPLGLSSEAPVVVVQEIEKERYIGGAGVVASHVAALGANCHLISVCGDDNQRAFAEEKLREYNVDVDVFVDENRPTTHKIRYIAGKQKLFRVSRLLDTDVNAALEKKIIARIKMLAKDLDYIIVSDFVYGVITEKILRLLTSISKKYDIQMFGDLQCSSQVGNVLKFKNFNTIYPTEKEARIAIKNKDDGLEYVAQTVFKKANCNNLVIKLGAGGLIAYTTNEDHFVEREHFPALSSNPVDVSGAGDSVLAAMSTAIVSRMSLFEAAAFGSAVAACAVEVLGNFPISAAVACSRLVDVANAEEVVLDLE